MGEFEKLVVRLVNFGFGLKSEIRIQETDNLGGFIYSFCFNIQEGGVLKATFFVRKYMKIFHLRRCKFW